ncbi:MAG: 4Fe-4S binding protein [Thermodesulfobacteriota bacterium]
MAQTAFFILFAALLAAGTVLHLAPESQGAFLRLDPSLTAIAALGSRALTVLGLPAALVLLSALVLGRAFCGHVCPMGATEDFLDRAASRSRKGRSLRPGSVRYGILIFLVVAAVFGGLNLSYGISPLSLATRLYAMVLFPALAFLFRLALDLFRPLAQDLGFQSIAFAQVREPFFTTQFFLWALFAALFAAARLTPRFFCRFFCPAGAMLSLLSRKPILGRRVSQDCTRCGKCARSCPMSAIPVAEPGETVFSECILCGTCESLCPAGAVSFGVRAGRGGRVCSTDFSRRGVLAAGLMGAVSAAGLAGASTLLAAPAARPFLLRPPGAMPEDEFLARCARCGQCAAVCPTNTLQPVWTAAGWGGVFSPAVTPDLAFCDPKCTRCGASCPTGAIRPLSPQERIWARIGTAGVDRKRCVAWAGRQACMACDEVCPYDAVRFSRPEGYRFAVPQVAEKSCSGCGACQHACPVRGPAAIRVSSKDALRLSEGSFVEAGRRRGYDLRLVAEKQEDTPAGAVPPEELAPGFDP